MKSKKKLTKGRTKKWGPLKKELRKLLSAWELGKIKGAEIYIPIVIDHRWGINSRGEVSEYSRIAKITFMYL